LSPFIDIIIPTYNRIEFLLKTLESISNLESADLCEVYVFINGSSDGTKDVLNKKYNWVNIINSNQNLSISSSWNKSKLIGSNKYYMLLHDDDMLKENYLIELKNFIYANKNCALIHSGAILIDELDHQIGITKHVYDEVMNGEDYFKTHIHHGLQFICPSVVYNRDLIPKSLKYNINLGYTLDVEFFLKCTRYGKVGYIDKPIFKYRIHNHSISSNFFKNYHLKIKDRIEHRHFLELEINNRLGTEFNYLAVQYFRASLSVDMLMYRLGQNKINFIQSFKLVSMILNQDAKIFFKKIFWKNLFKLFLPQFIINFHRLKKRKLK
jgi:glycosyltransferase involved in cell wall biosynthesis